MQTELVRQLTIEDLSQNAVLDYIDGDIAFANRLRLPHVPHAKPVKIDALKLLICTKGTLQVDVNTKTRIIRANEVLCCLPLTVLRNAIGSDDLECKGIAISMNIVRRLVRENYNWSKPIRSVGVRGADLVTDNYWEQIDLFSSVEKREKQMKMDSAVDDIRRRFGFYSIQRGLMYRDRILSAVNAKEEHTVHPHGYFSG